LKFFNSVEFQSLKHFWSYYDSGCDIKMKIAVHLKGIKIKIFF
jgi:hypothetical protein